MRILTRFLFAMLLTAVSLPALAQDPKVTALGGTALVLEEDTTALNLFNLGNPAAAAFLPHLNRMDWLVQATWTDRVAEFTTGPAGDPSTFDPFGNTLQAQAVFHRKTAKWNARLNEWGSTGYGGYMVWVDPQVLVQIQPLGELSSLQSPGLDTGYFLASAGAAVRAGWLLTPKIAVGGGVEVSDSKRSGWNPPDLQTFALGTTAGTFLSEREDRTRSWSAEAAAAWRQDAVVDTQDFLDLGVTATGEKTRTQARHESGNVFLPPVPGFASFQLDDTAWPLEIKAAGIYDYKSALDISLSLGFQSEKLFRSLSSDTIAPQGEHLAALLDNIDYELQFRVRLPMVREDDLRFGVVFDNRSDPDHPFPSGRLLQFQDNGLYSDAPVVTNASSIGIGGAFVPETGSIIALEYHLGSSKSRTDAGVLADSGSNRFGFGAQYSPMRGLSLRFGFSDRQIKFQTQVDGASTTVTSQATDALSLGVTVEDGPFSVDLTGVVERVTHSPQGWMMLDKPAALPAVNQDSEQRLSVLLAFRWRYQ